MTRQATLVTDGSSDTVLIPILRWLFQQLTAEVVELRHGDLRWVRHPPKTMPDRLTLAVELFPCDLLFVHRDAEGQNPTLRYDEIAKANATGRPHVCVVPIRMQEAWLLHDETTLRQAAGRPSGTEPLKLPPPARWEALSDPKATLHKALRVASGAKGRRARKFSPSRAAHRLADLVDDWGHLRALSAFKRLESETRTALAGLGLEVLPPTA
jgi:hypothetical protein